ncbi:MAG: hypothetical protein ACJAZD_002780, partial [Ilumatobacter sp.]
VWGTGLICRQAAFDRQQLDAGRVLRLAARRRLEFLDSRDVELLLARGSHDPWQFLAVASASISSLNRLS